MRIEIVGGETGWPLVEALDEEVYPPDVMQSVPWRNVTWAHADKRAIVVEDDAVRCHAGIFYRDGRLAGQTTRIAGIGGVMTSPHYRGRGFARAAILAAAEEMGLDRAEFGLLFCEPKMVPFYAALGWCVFEGPVWFEQPQGREKFDYMAAMCLALRTTPVCGEIDLCGLPW